jgi:predicted RNase H-like HicB family nuclease
MAKKPTKYTVTDGKLVLTLEVDETGGYVVTSPMDLELITEAESLEEAFEMARDALSLLKQARKVVRKPAPAVARKI